MAGRGSSPSTEVQAAHVLLSRLASLAERPGVVMLEEDLTALDEQTGSRSRSHAVLRHLERAGRLRQVRRGVYVLTDAAGGSRVDVLDLIAASTPDPYLVSGGRALQFHGLTDQHFRRVHVLAPSQRRAWSWRGDEVRYVRTADSLRQGAVRTRKTLARVATPARAIADSLSHPRWGVTLSQVVEAVDISLVRDARFAESLAAEAARQRDHSLARRLGLLVGRIGGDDAARPFLSLRGDGKASTPLLAGGPAGGLIDPRWRVRVNVDFDRLLEHRVIA